MALPGQRTKSLRWSICCVTAVLAASCLQSLILAKGDAGDSQATGHKAVHQYEKYLSENAKLPGVTKTLSGLQYSVIASGDGPQPGPNTPCAVHYRGTLIDGRRFGGFSRHSECLQRSSLLFHTLDLTRVAGRGYRRHGQHNVWISSAVRA